MHSFPNESWTLADWFAESGLKTDQDIIDIGTEIGTTSHKIRGWMDGRGNRPPGVPDRETALQMIMVLRAGAHHNKRPLFQDDKLREHARIFLQSKACVQTFASLDDSEIWHICHHVPQSTMDSTSDQKHSNLRQKVQPTPPAKLFGREDDINRVLTTLMKNSIAIIDGIGGEGKTALAWYSAIKACDGGLARSFDWITDKRYLVDLHGNIQHIAVEDHSDDFLEKICKSMVRRFGWAELYGALGTRLINGCADRLRKERYLIVCDNLETVEESDRLVRQLYDMLTPIGNDEPVASRVLITSRQQADFPHCPNIALTGINPESTAAFIDYLQTMWQITPPLTTEDMMTLAQLSRGNPLLIQIIIRRYALAPTSQTVESIIASLETGKVSFFDAVFSPLFSRMSHSAQELAVHLAAEFTFARTLITDDVLTTIWADLDLDVKDHLMTVLRELIKNRVLSWSGENGYTMHSLIRSHLLGSSTGMNDAR